MSLCSLCLTVPWLSLPSPRNINFYLTSDEKSELGLCLYRWVADEAQDSQSLQQPLGFPFHENMGALELSAESCPLCAVIWSGVQAWTGDWHKAVEDEDDRDSIVSNLETSPVPVEEQLWVTKSFNEAQGFCVWTKTPRPSICSMYLLATVGFSVDSGTVPSMLQGFLCLEPD